VNMMGTSPVGADWSIFCARVLRRCIRNTMKVRPMSTNTPAPTPAAMMAPGLRGGGTHTEEPCGLTKAPGQGVQVTPVIEYVSAAHTSHLSCEALGCVPGGHTPHSVEFGGAYVAGPHGTHVTLEVDVVTKIEAYVPPKHAKQENDSFEECHSANSPGLSAKRRLGLAASTARGPPHWMAPTSLWSARCSSSNAPRPPQRCRRW